MKTILRELILEVGELKERLTFLEQEVRQQRQSANTVEDAAFTAQYHSPDQLGQLYREGYHVCPMAFGQERADGCLFCVSFMARGGR